MASRAGTLNRELDKSHWSLSTSVLDPLVTFKTVRVTSLLCLDQTQIRLGKGSRSRRLLPPIGHPPCSLPLQILSLRNSFASMGDVSNIPRELLPGHLVRSDFWFRDGNIVIIAGSAAFKVHRGQLERHSEIFSDLFSIPQPTEQDLIDGCSYVELPDCPSDVFYFLSALYDGLCVRILFRQKVKMVSEHLIFHLADTFKPLSPLAFLLYLPFYAYQPNTSLSIFDNVVSRVSIPIGHQLSVDGILENEGQQTSMAVISLATFVHILSPSSNLP